MATLFIAVQCSQCSTMQVKQQKKSGNKWVCAVCNQRQSVRRIHARGPLARDLRNFVQAFNMARADIASDGPDPVPPRSDAWSAAGGEARSDVSHGSPFSSAKKRTDWSEYLDPGEDERDDDKDEELGAEVVTELPREKLGRSSFPKCTQRVQSSAAGSERKRGLSFKPAFATRKRMQTGLEESRELGGGKAAAMQGKGGPSRWSEYLEEGDDVMDSLPQEGGGQLEAWNGTRHELFDEVAVQEEVHPDFM